MIKCDKEVIKISGYESDIYAEFGLIMQTCYRKYGEEQFNRLVELAKKSDEELQVEALKMIREFSERLNDIVSGFGKKSE